MPLNKQEHEQILRNQIREYFASDSQEPFFYLETPSGSWQLALASVEEPKEGNIFFAGIQFFSSIEKASKKTKKNPWAKWPKEFCFQPKHYYSGEKNDFRDLYSTEAALSDPLEITKISNPNTPSEWKTLFQQSMDLLANDVQKIVVARMEEFDLQKKSMGSNLHEIWQKFSSTTFPNAYKFFICHAGEIFMGASPEILFQQEKQKIFSPAIAGTVKKSNLPSVQLEKLLRSEKNLKEHQYVVDYIFGKFQEIGGKISYATKPDTLSSKNLLHLYTPIMLEAETIHKPLDILHTLHPTPALCGLPQELTLQFLYEQEPFERGYYASPIGFYDPLNNTATFIIGIRSILISKNSIFSFAGAGIVAESNSKEEWQEIDEKMQTMLSMFTIKN